MRLTCFGIVIVLMMGLGVSRTNGQIPERIHFQPGSYAYGMNQGVANTAIATETILVDVPDDSFVREDNSDMTDWEQTFGSSGSPAPRAGKVVKVQVPVHVATEQAVCQPPYLAYHRHPITHRIHVVPYQPGYAINPDAYPKHQSKLNLWLSTLPCREQNRPQVKYLGHYDPMPIIIEDKPSRCQLILGYPNPNWTSCCYNQYGQRLAQCPSIDAVAVGPSAEAAIRNQYCDNHVPQGPLGGILAGPRPIGEGPAHQCHQCEPCQGSPMENY